MYSPIWTPKGPEDVFFYLLHSLKSSWKSNTTICRWCFPQTTHGTGIFTYIDPLFNHPNWSVSMPVPWSAWLWNPPEFGAMPRWPMMKCLTPCRTWTPWEEIVGMEGSFRRSGAWERWERRKSTGRGPITFSKGGFVHRVCTLTRLKPTWVFLQFWKFILMMMMLQKKRSLGSPL